MVGAAPVARLITVVGVSTALALGGLIIAPRPAVADDRIDAAAAAARWQAAEVVDGGMPGLGGTPDWGLTIDTLIALEATGVAPDTSREITDTLAAHVRDYNSLDAWSEPGQRIAGATAKLLYAAVVTDSDPTRFGEYDLRAETLDLVAGPETGPENGRVKDKVNAPSVDNSNTFGQALAVLGLARSGDLPENVVEFLIDQQCSAGGFRLYPYAFGGGTVTGDCDSQDGAAVLDPDSTAMAVQALLAADEHAHTPGARDAALAGADWLLTQQHSDGSFGGSGPTAAPNSNSTGLAGQALAATGHDDAAARAADWVLSHQLTADTAGAATAELGAIAYNPEALEAARTDGIGDFQRDQWRRATAQALLAPAGIALGDIGTEEVVAPPSDGSPDPDDDPTGPVPPVGADQLPVTGSPVTTIVVAGVALLLVAVALLMSVRRTGTSQETHR